MRHFEHQALGTLDHAVAAGDFVLPVFFGQREVAHRINFKSVFGSLPAKYVELAVDDAESVGIAAPGDSVNNAVGTVAAKLRQVLFGLFVKQGFVRCGRKTEGDAFVVAFYLGCSLHIFTLREIGHDIGTFQHHTRILLVSYCVHWLQAG